MARLGPGAGRSAYTTAASPQTDVQTTENAALLAFQNGDFARSADLFRSIIGSSPVSLFLSKFARVGLDRYVIQHLIEVHKRGLATAALTKLLFSMFALSENQKSLHSFLKDIELARKSLDERSVAGGCRGQGLFRKQKEVAPRVEADTSKRFFLNFDADAAIETLNANKMESEASYLAQIIGISSELVAQLVEQGKFVEAATLIFDHYEEPIGHVLLLRYGPVLLERNANAGKIVEQTATLVWKIGRYRKDSEYIKLFWGYPACCFHFLKSVIDDEPTSSMANVLISLTIPNASATKDSFYGNPAVASENEAMRVLSNPKLAYDAAHIANVCVLARFWRGYVFVMGKLQRQSDALFTLVQEKAIDAIVTLVLDNWKLPVDDWFFLFDAVVEMWSLFAAHEKRVEFVETVIGNLESSSSLLRERAAGNREIVALVERVCSVAPPNTLQKVTDKILGVNSAGKRLESHSLGSDKSSCVVCHGQLTPPYVTFFCGHSVHKSCIELREPRCPVDHQ